MKPLQRKITTRDLLEDFIEAKRNPLHEMAIKEVVRKALDARFSREEIFEIGVRAGYTEQTVRGCISELADEFGVRMRAPGAGRKRPKDATELANYAREKYGTEAASMLLAAYREIKGG